MKHPLAVYLAETGRPLSDLAKVLRVQPPAISKWSRRGVPATRVLALEAATGIPRTKLRPDLYPASSLEPAGRPG